MWFMRANHSRQRIDLNDCLPLSPILCSCHFSSHHHRSDDLVTTSSTGHLISHTDFVLYLIASCASRCLLLLPCLLPYPPILPRCSVQLPPVWLLLLVSLTPLVHSFVLKPPFDPSPLPPPLLPLQPPPPLPNLLSNSRCQRKRRTNVSQPCPPSSTAPTPSSPALLNSSFLLTHPSFSFPCAADWEAFDQAKLNLYVVASMIGGYFLVKYWYHRELDHFLHHRHQQEPYAFFIKRDDAVAAGFWPGRACQFMEFNCYAATYDAAEKMLQEKEGGHHEEEHHGH